MMLVTGVIDSQDDAQSQSALGKSHNLMKKERNWYQNADGSWTGPKSLH